MLPPVSPRLNLTQTLRYSLLLHYILTGVCGQQIWRFILYQQESVSCFALTNAMTRGLHAQYTDRNLSGVVCDWQWMMTHSAERKNVIVLWSRGNLLKKSPSFTKTHILLNKIIWWWQKSNPGRKSLGVLWYIILEMGILMMMMMMHFIYGAFLNTQGHLTSK